VQALANGAIAGEADLSSDLLRTNPVQSRILSEFAQCPNAAASKAAIRGSSFIHGFRSGGRRATLLAPLSRGPNHGMTHASPAAAPIAELQPAEGLI
jgi:hypothetical protein